MRTHRHLPYICRRKDSAVNRISLVAEISLHSNRSDNLARLGTMTLTYLRCQ